jgi:hypothetical protein
VPVHIDKTSYIVLFCQVLFCLAKGRLPIQASTKDLVPLPGTGLAPLAQCHYDQYPVSFRVTAGQVSE